MAAVASHTITSSESANERGQIGFAWLAGYIFWNWSRQSVSQSAGQSAGLYVTVA